MVYIRPRGSGHHNAATRHCRTARGQRVDSLQAEL